MWLSPLQNLLYACFCCFLVLVLVLLFLRICICFCIVKAVVFLSFMALMATVAVRVIPINPRSNVGVLYLGPRRYGFGMELRCSGALESSRKWEYLAVLAQKAITLVDDDKPFTPGVESSGPIHHLFDKDLDLLPKPLSATDLSASPANDREVRIAYQGKPGGYSEAAALKAYPKCEAVPCDQFEVAFKTVELWLADKAVIPIENTVAGSMHRNYDLLLRHRLHIVGEVKLAVNHCLLGLPGVKKDELKHVLSHPQVLAQCEMLLSNLGIAQVSADDTAGAAQTVASSGIRDIGAIASARAAEIYGLDILAERIQDEDSVTRFLILAREPILPGTDRPYKTSIVFSLEKGPSVLFKALVLFALRGIRMSNIESRPLKKRPFRVVDDSNKATAECFDYLFYIDFEASIADPRVQYALEHLEQEHTSFLRVLGCYPMDKSL